MRSRLVVPDTKARQLVPHFLTVQGNEGGPTAVGLHRQDESFDQRDATVLSDCAVTRLDAPALTPAFEPPTPELCSLVADQILRGICTVHGRTEKGPDLLTGRLRPKDGNTHATPRVVVQCDRNPPAERPTLR